MSGEGLTERDLEVIDSVSIEIMDYVSSNPGTSKEAIIGEMQARNLASRVTTFKRIQQLIEQGSIIAQKEKPNSQIYRLYISHTDKASAIMQEIRAFERSFFMHLRKVVDICNRTKLINGKEEASTTKLVIYTCGFFYLVTGEYLSLARGKWPVEIHDDETLRRLYSNFFIRIAKMEMRLIDYARHELVVSHAVSQSVVSFPWVGPVYTRLLKKYNLYDEFQRVIGSLKSVDVDFLFSGKI